eukprot:CAMPEP_0170512084 /NCGR_PEP_ID=MMETSP0208-20121228/66656_1 /TAXON_ID=197538 /ORGANISM="Strombidium inclinatum, Strain S3" /LENGTH=48 /DNA_ID= /DNA_START= /DNA_END= /DNA_ORIENTATION=
MKIESIYPRNERQPNPDKVEAPGEAFGGGGLPAGLDDVLELGQHRELV